MINLCKKILSIVVIMVLCVSTVGAAPVQNISQWARESFNAANAAGIIPQSQLLGDYTATLHRGYVAELLARAYNSITGEEYRSRNKSPFKDAFSNNVNTVYELGIMNGKSDDRFGYTDKITREEMAKVVLTFKAVAMNSKLNLTVQMPSFADNDQISDWAKPYVATATAEGLISGYPDGTFKGKEEVSWEMAITLIMRCCNYDYKDVPVISSLTWNQVIPSNQPLTIQVEGNGYTEVYGVNINDMGYPKHLVSGACGDNLRVNSGVLKENSLYYIYAECDGVFSEPVKVYTDAYNLFLCCEDWAEAGEYVIAWERIPNASKYVINVTENRASYYEGDIPPNTTETFEVVYENYLKVNFNPNRRYTIEVSADGKTASTIVYVMAKEAEGANEIYMNYPQTKEQADALQAYITVPVWRMNSRGQKYASTASFSVHYMIAEKVKLVFEEIFNGPEQFPIKDIGGYYWRGGTTEHNGGTAIDINSNENYCVYSNGTTIGSHWKPYVDPYSITPYGDVVRAFEKYGFTWGGDSWSNPKDYMHFSYLGT